MEGVGDGGGGGCRGWRGVRCRGWRGWGVEGV